MRVTLTVYRIGIVAIGRVRLRARSCARARLLRGCSSVVSRRIRLIPERGPMRMLVYCSRDSFRMNQLVADVDRRGPYVCEGSCRSSPFSLYTMVNARVAGVRRRTLSYRALTSVFLTECAPVTGHKQVTSAISRK